MACNVGCFDHVVVLDQRTNGDLELITNGEAIPELVHLDGVVTALGISQIEPDQSDVLHVARAKTGIQAILSGEGGVEIQCVAIREVETIAVAVTTLFVALVTIGNFTALVKKSA